MNAGGARRAGLGGDHPVTLAQLGLPEVLDLLLALDPAVPRDQDHRVLVEQDIYNALRVADRGYTAEEGIGIHWQRHLKPGARRGSKREEDLLFGPHTLGHGSFSGCIFLVDPDQELVVAQVRKRSGPRSAEWSPRFFQTVAAVLCE